MLRIEDAPPSEMTSLRATTNGVQTSKLRQTRQRQIKTGDEADVMSINAIVQRDFVQTSRVQGKKKNYGSSEVQTNHLVQKYVNDHNNG